MGNYSVFGKIALFCCLKDGGSYFVVWWDSLQSASILQIPRELGVKSEQEIFQALQRNQNRQKCISEFSEHILASYFGKSCFFEATKCTSLVILGTKQPTQMLTESFDLTLEDLMTW